MTDTDHISKEPRPAQILRLTADEYHLRPGLSASIASTLIARSPLHAHTQHPCFGGKGKTPTAAMDFGSVAHRLVLGAGKDFAPLPFDDWRTKAARESRDNARAEGKTPILGDDFIHAEEVARNVKEQLPDHGVFLDGESEVAIEWWEPAGDVFVRCRGMLDHLRIDHGEVIDLKFTDNAATEKIEKSAENFGYAIQRAAYDRALTALRPSLAGRTSFIFAFCEKEAPYAINAVSADGIFRELGERRWLRAVATWAQCLKDNYWPAYGTGINTITPPAWALAREGYSNDTIL